MSKQLPCDLVVAHLRTFCAASRRSFKSISRFLVSLCIHRCFVCVICSVHIHLRDLWAQSFFDLDFLATYLFLLQVAGLSCANSRCNRCNNATRRLSYLFATPFFTSSDFHLLSAVVEAVSLSGSAPCTQNADYHFLAHRDYYKNFESLCLILSYSVLRHHSSSCK
ncbi:hypothetical protein BDP27DRAFT_128952 [Rhodocollybia butyracea]|uniref:Uncharacterized protein n=1 Tax=Rhodocollybia butyracea TaxID=206335 RepID=A0A9P5PG77_9AGAR|nr:hypothetical protein BDP27DRAFT_128952 [Rhodocollybia butyracea]